MNLLSNGITWISGNLAYIGPGGTPVPWHVRASPLILVGSIAFLVILFMFANSSKDKD
jgi:hypothetical protein